MAASSDTTRAVRRRGILAAAGAVVAGIVAKQTAQPVRASTDTNFVAHNGSGTAFGSDVSGYDIGVDVTGASYGVFAKSTSGGGVYGSSTSGDGVHGSSTSGHGVDGSSTNGHGVHGFSSGDHGVVGQTGAPDGLGKVGVYGYGKGSGTAGVLGDCSFGGTTTTGNAAVQGINAQYGVIGNVNNAPNTIAVWGNNTSTGSNATGVVGTSNTGSGVIGGTTLAAPGVAGGYFYTTASNGSGVVGQVYGASGAAAFVGAANPPNYAAYFTGNVVVQGKLVVSDPSYKSGALQHPDGSHRLVYCVESPESWIEDVGTGTLTSGKATITFDKDFAAVTHTDIYHVFLTPYGSSSALRVAARRGDGFTVEEIGGTSSGTFSWKVMVKAKSSVKSERLEKFTMPNIKLADAPPHVPDLPPATTPPKKP